MLARAKPDPLDAHIDAEAEFVAARNHWQREDASFNALIDRFEKLQLALSLAARTEAELKSERLESALAKAGEFLHIARRRPAKVAEELAELRIKIEDLKLLNIREREAFDAACRVYTDHLAGALQQRQRAVVRRMHDAMSSLTEAMIEERAIRSELEIEAPLPTSALLPDASMPIAGFDDWHSQVSQWARRMRSIGILK